jgi:hypothetical protein
MADVSYVLLVEIEHMEPDQWHSRYFTEEAFGPFESERAAWDYAIKERGDDKHPMDYAHEVLELQAPNG